MMVELLKKIICSLVLDSRMESYWPQTCTQTRHCISSCSKASPGRASIAPSGTDMACRHPGEPGSLSASATVYLHKSRYREEKLFIHEDDDWNAEIWPVHGLSPDSVKETSRSEQLEEYGCKKK